MFLLMKKDLLIKKYYDLLKEKNLNSNGSIRASPDTEPNYNYHWVRDSNIIVSLLIDLFNYLNSNNLNFINKYEILEFIEKFVDFEIKISKIDLLTGFGEPKINLDGTPFSEPWGRPQNDGAPLRILTYFKIIKNFGYLKNKVQPLILKNLEYLKENWEEKNFDLWEEVYGFHYYTKTLQLEAFEKVQKEFGLNLNYYINGLKIFVEEFIKNGRIISTIKANPNDYHRDWLDTSIFMASLHMNKKHLNLNEELKTGDILVQKFREIYPINKNNKFQWLGRYPEDSYYGGNPWVITTLAFNNYLFINNKISKEEFKSNLLYMDDVIENAGENPEQLDKENLSKKSAFNLGWNCVEMIRCLINL